MSATLELQDFRSLFPAVANCTYLSICDKMILADPVRAATGRFLDKLANASATRVDHERFVESAREKFARLVGASPSEIAVIRNVSDATNSVAWAFPWQDGDNVVIAGDAEHPNNIYPWLRLKSRGVSVRMVPAVAGVIDPAAMIDAMDARTRIMSCASVTFAPGLRTNLDRLGRACRERDVLLMVDGVQSAGILHHDFATLPIDGFATSTSKGLLGLYGFGFLYLRQPWMQRLEPAYLSRPAVDIGNDDASEIGDRDYVLHADGRRFEVGSYNLIGAYAADAALDLILEIGTETIERHVLGLARHFSEGLAELDLSPTPVRDEAERSHIVTAGLCGDGGHGYSNNPLITALYERLAAEGVVMTVRRGQLRFGLHFYNNEDDIERALAILADARGRL